MGKFIDLTGQKFGRLTVLGRIENNKYGSARWKCECECGNKTTVMTGDLRSGDTQSCGCLNRETATTHGKTGTRLYRIWSAMHRRCNNKNAINYEDYGNRGIMVCAVWSAFEPFYDWAMTNGYNDGLTIDRIDNNADYNPQNCRWVTMTTQNRNQRIRKDNTSGVRGVHWHSRDNEWTVTIGIGEGKHVYLGAFDALDSAIAARIEAEKEYWGANGHDRPADISP